MNILIIVLNLLGRLKSLSEKWNTFFLNELLQPRDKLNDFSFSVIPNTNRIVFESRRQAVLDCQLKHFCLFLTHSIYSMKLAIIHMVYKIFKHALKLIIESNQLVILQSYALLLHWLALYAHFKKFINYFNKILIINFYLQLNLSFYSRS